MRKIGLLILLLITFASTSDANNLCFEEAAQEYIISPTLLEGIAQAESSMNPLKINYNSDGSYDVGLMQINSSWYETLGPDLWNALSDPCTNIRVGAWILSDCISRLGYTWEAVGCYNAVTPSKRYNYALKVQKKVLALLQKEQEEKNVNKSGVIDNSDNGRRETRPGHSIK